MSEYLFHANALGVGGVVTSGNRRNVIPSHAAVVLSAAGGVGHAAAGSYDDHGVSFSSATTNVVGAEIANGILETYADVLITDFAVYDALGFPRLQIARMQAQMTSTRNLQLNESEFNVQLSYSGININGGDVEPDLDIQLCGAATFNDAANALGAPAGVQAVSGSLVKGFRPPGSTAVTSPGCVLPIPNVGRAHFAEFEFKPGDRRLRLLRVKLQSGAIELAVAGDGAVAESTGGDGGYIVAGAVEGNGSPPF